MNAPKALVPFAHVRSVQASIAFYEKLGFAVANTFVPPGQPEPSWAWLRSVAANLMLAKASEPVIAEQQAVLFYVYVDDVPAKREELAAAGITVGEIAYPFYAERGEFRISDPDGYTLMIINI